MIDEIGLGIGVLDREAFRSWLQAHMYEWVGAPCITDACPLAMYLYERTGRQWHVSILGCVTVDREVAYPLPVWAKQFVKAVDMNSTQCSALLGQDALERLDFVERMYSGLLEGE